MSGEFEAAGAMATAGLAASAIEGGEARKPGDGECLNCGAALTGPYCSQCGQGAHPHRSLAHMLEEVLHGLFHFDTKAWRTLPMLVGRPGTLTRGYIHGKRARYISPLALFLFTIFLMFFVFSFVEANIFHVNTTPSVMTEEMRADLRDDIREARAELQAARTRLAAARAARGDAPPSNEQRLNEAANEREIAISEGVAAQLEARLERAPDAPPTGISVGPAPARPANDNNAEASGDWKDDLREAARNGQIHVNTGFPRLDQRITHSLENPDLALYKIQQAAYKLSFLLVPISLPFICLLFLWKRGLTLYDHVVFTLYSLSFASLAFIVMALVNSVSWLEWVGGVVMLGLLVHMFFHLKGAYALGWWSAIWRTLFLLVFAWLSLAVFVVLIIVLGLGG